MFICIATPVPLQWNLTVAGITGSLGISASQLAGPYGVAWDSSVSLYIADSINNRVQKWIIGSSTGAIVAGQTNGASGNNSSHLHAPSGLLFDSDDDLYAINKRNH
jgi:sugar lactone lactonase YvrE